MTGAAIHETVCQLLAQRAAATGRQSITQLQLPLPTYLGTSGGDSLRPHGRASAGRIRMTCLPNKPRKGWSRPGAFFLVHGSSVQASALSVTGTCRGGLPMRSHQRQIHQ